MTEGSRGTVAIWLVAAVIATVAVLRLTDSGGGGGAAVRVDRSAGDSGGAGRADAGAARGIYVHVAGAVRRPGLVTLPSGSRVALAVERAGGLLRKADLSGVNLAARLEDGQQVLVPVRGAAVAPAGTAGRDPARPGRRSSASRPRPSTSSTSSTASVPTLAERIVEYRTEHGGFRSLAELREVDGIGEKRFETLQRRAAAVSLLRHRPWHVLHGGALACGLALRRVRTGRRRLATGAVLAAALARPLRAPPHRRGRGGRAPSGRRGGRGAAARRDGRSRAADPRRRARRAARPSADAASPGRVRLVRRGGGDGGPLRGARLLVARRALGAAAASRWRSATSCGWRAGSRRWASGGRSGRRATRPFDFAAHLRRRGVAGELLLDRARRDRAAAAAGSPAGSTACASAPSGPWSRACPPTDAALLRGMVLGQDEAIDERDARRLPRRGPRPPARGQRPERDAARRAGAAAAGAGRARPARRGSRRWRR